MKDAYTLEMYNWFEKCAQKLIKWAELEASFWHLHWLYTKSNHVVSLSGVYSVFYSKTISAQSFNNFKSQEHNYHIAGNATKKKNLYLLLSTMILRWRKSFLVQRLSLRVWGGYWAGMCNWNAHRSLRTRTDVEAQRKAHRHKRTDMHVLLCPADQATRTSAQWRRVLYFQKWCMIGTIKHKEKKCYCASTHNYLMLFANRCLLYFDISLLFSIFQMFVNI